MKMYGFVITALVFILSSCAAPGPNVPGGFIYSGVKGPVTATSASKASKTGMACGSNILSFIAMGDNSIDSAKANGGIKRVASVDYDFFSVLGLYTKVCTIVKGK